MPLVTYRNVVLERVVDAARRDQRIAGLLLAGSLSEGRGDQWSDLDLTLFIDDQYLLAFAAEWRVWAAALGRPLLAYISGVGHPWVIYDTSQEPGEPENWAMPMRADFNFLPVSAVPEIAAWPMRPLNLEAAVLYDGTGGQLSAVVAQLVGQSLAPADLGALFEQVNGDLWYYLIRTYVKLKRGELWMARQDYHFVVLGNLIAMLRLESAGHTPAALDGWRQQSAASRIEDCLSPGRLAELNECIPAGLTAGDLLLAMQRVGALGQTAGATIAAWGGWPWPAKLAQEVRATLAGESGQAADNR